MSAAVSIRHEEPARRFVADVGGKEAFLSYRRDGDTMDLYHTFVPEASRGRGIAEQLSQAAFDYARAKRLRVIPSCPYISGAYLKRHPEYQDLVTSAS